MIKTSQKEPLKSKIPNNFSYVYFEISENEGYCYIIEDDFQPHRLRMREIVAACVEIDQLKDQVLSLIHN